MLIPLTEPSNFRYIGINPTTNRVHLLVPFIAGQNISTDNTCKSEVELKAFFEGGAVSELESYKSTLEFHISLLEEGELRQVKEARLAQINTYLETVIGMRESYKNIVNDFLSQPSNLYSIQLRPRIQDPYSRVVNPAFTINRKNNIQGAPLSSLYNKMHEVFPTLTLGKPDPRTQLITAVLNALPTDPSFENIQNMLAKQCKVPEDFFKRMLDKNNREHVVDKDYVDTLMMFDKDTSPEEYINALLGVCAPNLQTTLQGSPFYLDTSANQADKTERLSILVQFYLGVLNVHCRATGISNKNFGKILDGSTALSQELVKIVAQALSRGDEVEDAVVAFFNVHKKTFNLSQDLTTKDKEAIQQKFEITYRTVTATKENPHMDDFMLLDTEASGENNLFVTSNGLICTNFANIIPSNPNQRYFFAKIRNEARTHPKLIMPQNEPVITVDIEAEGLIDKLSDVQWERLPKEIAEACRASPSFQARQLLDDVAKGKQDEADIILESFVDQQTILKTPGKFTDYSGRRFHCTAYEYAYWAKDTHMCRMLERYMDDETKTQLLEKIEKMDRSGLAYQQHGVSYQNPHYDMSFVLKNLNPDEFHQLQTMLGRNISKIQQATADNYRTIPFTAIEYEALQKELAKKQKNIWSRFLVSTYPVHVQCLYYLAYPLFFILSLFITSTAKKLSNKLQFDFHSLIIALKTYVNHYDKWNDHEREMAWMSVGKAQRDVPAHIAHEYCRPDRIFDPEAEFNEEILLPRVLIFCDCEGRHKLWFPLPSLSSGLGFDFALAGVDVYTVQDGIRVPNVGTSALSFQNSKPARDDLLTVRHLDEVRTADLAQSRENLSQPANQLGMVY